MPFILKGLVFSWKMSCSKHLLFGWFRCCVIEVELRSQKSLVENSNKYHEMIQCTPINFQNLVKAKHMATWGQKGHLQEICISRFCTLILHNLSTHIEA